jgi:hypothetical protein
MISDLKFREILRLLRGFVKSKEILPGRRHIQIYYQDIMSMPLRKIAESNGTDKGGRFIDSTNIHAYTDFYFILLSSRRFEKLAILECGIGSNDIHVPSNMGLNGKPGASLRMWKEFFPNAMIFGCDIDPKTLITEDRIQTFEVNQLDKESFRNKLQSLNKTFDIIIDDGLHSFESITNMLSVAFEYLDTNGIYVVEDLDTSLIARLAIVLENIDSHVHHYFINFREKNYRDQGGWLLVVQKYK